MSESTVVIRCPAVSRLAPELEGLETVDGQWQLAVEPHRDLLVDVTGIDPVDELELQHLATVTARLEGYVSARKQRTDRAGQSTHPRGDAAGIFSRFLRLLAAVLPDSVLGSTGTGSDPGETGASYDTERVYQLSRFFRATLEARREDIERGSERRPGPVPAE